MRSDNEPVRIPAARAAELLLLQEIERVPGQMFSGIGMLEIAQYEPRPLQTLTPSQQAGLPGT